MTALCLSMIEQQLEAWTPVQCSGEGWTIDIAGLRIQNGCNLREHWAKRAKRVKRERFMAGFALVGRMLKSGSKAPPALPLVVTLTRLAPRMLDSDNAVAGFKGVRDEVASFLGVNDNDPRVTWRYAQEKAKGYAARIQIEGAK